MLRSIGIILTLVGVLALAVALWQRQASVAAAEELSPRAEKAMKEREAWANARYGGGVVYGDQRRENDIRAYEDAAGVVTTWNVVAGLCGAALLAGVLLLWFGRLVRPTTPPPTPP